MTSRMFAASIVLLGVAAMITPVETWARSGGLHAAPSLPARGAVRPFVAAPAFAHTSLPQRMIREFPGHASDFRVLRLGPGFPLWWSYASDVPNYYPSGNSVPYEVSPYGYPPTETFFERTGPAVARRAECLTDTRKVPSETGGERTINITHCY